MCGVHVQLRLVLPIRRKLNVEINSDSLVELRKYPHVPDSTVAANGNTSLCWELQIKKDKILCFG